MTTEILLKWSEQNHLSPIEIDCVIAVMLKILDEKCKMKARDKIIMEQLYDLLRYRPNQLLPQPQTNELIIIARTDHSEEMKNKVYEQRVLAETMISRPIMKSFKAMLRHSGLLN